LNILKKIHEALKKKIQFDDIYVSLSSNNKNFFRKPNPGMLIRAKKKYNINFKKSYLIGDRRTDIEAAKRAGCKAIFINRNYEELPPSYQIKTVKSFGEAVNFILLK